MPHVRLDDKTKIDEKRTLFFLFFFFFEFVAPDIRFVSFLRFVSFCGILFFWKHYYHCYPMHVIRWYVGHVIDDFAKEFRWFFICSFVLSLSHTYTHYYLSTRRSTLREIRIL